jgi:hypothetical protein
MGQFHRMTQPQYRPIRVRLGARAWATIIIGLFILGVILVAIAVLALGVFLFLLPFIAVMTLLYYLFPSLFRKAPYRQSADITIIDGDFRVVNQGEPERPRIEEQP